MMDGVRVVVVGAGVVGFSTAVCIAENLPHVSVTLLGEKFSPETTSDGAAGILFANHNPGEDSFLISDTMGSQEAKATNKIT